MAGAGKKAARERRRRRRLLLVWIVVLLIAAAAALIAFGLWQMFGPGGSANGEPSSISSFVSAPGGSQTDEASRTTIAETTASHMETTRQPTTASPVSAGRYVQKNRPVWNLLLVNDWNPVPENYLSTFTMADFNGPSKQCDSRIVEPLRQMINDGNAYNPAFRLSAASLYRTEELQAKNYNNKVNYYKSQGYDQETAESKAATVIKRPGESEHNTGLCVDLLGAGYSSLEQSFANTEAYQWLKEHCAEYGFILRYPKEKEAITAVIFEPWHYRYVGVEAATEIMERGICLEEYLQEKGL